MDELKLYLLIRDVLHVILLWVLLKIYHIFFHLFPFNLESFTEYMPLWGVLIEPCCLNWVLKIGVSDPFPSILYPSMNNFVCRRLWVAPASVFYTIWMLPLISYISSLLLKYKPTRNENKLNFASLAMFLILLKYGLFTSPIQWMFLDNPLYQELWIHPSLGTRYL